MTVTGIGPFVRFFEKTAKTQERTARFGFESIQVLPRLREAIAHVLKRGHGVGEARVAVALGLNQALLQFVFARAGFVFDAGKRLFLADLAGLVDDGFAPVEFRSFNTENGLMLGLRANRILHELRHLLLGVLVVTLAFLRHADLEFALVFIFARGEIRDDGFEAVQQFERLIDVQPVTHNHS